MNKLHLKIYSNRKELFLNLIIVFFYLHRQVHYRNHIVEPSHYYLYSAFNNANCVKAAVHQFDIKLGGFTSVLQYLDGEIVSLSSGQTKSAV